MHKELIATCLFLLAHNLRYIAKETIKLGKKIGYGGFGNVYLAELNGTLVAVKQVGISTVLLGILTKYINLVEINPIVLKLQ